jgi:hypothetical protein
MAWEQHLISSYSLWGVALNTPGYEHTYAFIRLKVATPGVRPTLWFYRDDAPTIRPNSSSPGGLIYGRFRARAFGDLMEILRNEKPVFFWWNPDSKGVFLATSDEPVGEEETPDAG